MPIQSIRDIHASVICKRDVDEHALARVRRTISRTRGFGLGRPTRGVMKASSMYTRTICYQQADKVLYRIRGKGMIK
eukprot:9493646-Pyramimonas_sp.AAC.1